MCAVNDSIFKKIKNLAAKDFSLLSLEIDVTNQCNCNCVFCFEGNNHNKFKKELSFEHIKKILLDARELGCLYLGISGGEPFLRRDIFNIINYAKDLGFRVSIITNGSLLTKKKIKILHSIGLDRITFSLHSLNRQTHQYLFNSNVSFLKKELNNIKECLRNEMNVGVAVTITKFNIDEIDNIQNYLTNLGISKNNISFNHLALGKKDIKFLLPSVNQLLSKKDLLVGDFEFKNKEFSDYFLCSAGRTSCSITANGDVKPCSFINISAGNVLYDSLVNIWNNSHLFFIFRSFKEEQFNKCLSCKLKSQCHVCIANNLNGSQNCFIPSDFICNYKYKWLTHEKDKS